MKLLYTLFSVLLSAFISCTSGGGGEGGDNQTQALIELEPAFPSLSFNRPLDLEHSGDGTDRLFVVEQAGVIYVFDNAPNVASAEVFLDIQDRVDDSANELGLLGLAFHPDYENNGFFYVNYTAANPLRSVIARYSVSAQDPNRADPNSELILLQTSQPSSVHNGGRLTFGPDGYLYIGLGDGGPDGDPQGNAQNLADLLGAILRIDVDNPEGGMNYGIPDDNPFSGNQAGIREEVYAYGLRNPWRFSFDPLTGRLWAGDVGQNAREEVDIIESGRNYGWDIMEGSMCFNPPSGCDMTGIELPIWEYSHNLGRSITGGFVYRGSDIPELFGLYVYGDFISGRVWTLEYDGVNPPVNTELLTFTPFSVVSFGVDEDDELYVCSFDGMIYKFKRTVVASGN